MPARLGEILGLEAGGCSRSGTELKFVPENGWNRHGLAATGAQARVRCLVARSLDDYVRQTHCG